MESELVKDETTLEMWIRVGLAREFGPVSGYLLRRSWEAVQVRDGNLLLECLSEARAMVASAELELESTAQGDAFYRTISRLGFEWAALKWVKALVEKAEGPVPYSFAVGVVTSAGGIPLDMTLTAFFHAMVSNQVSGALRLMRLGQTAGQSIIARLELAIIEVARDVMGRKEEDVGTAMPMLELCSMLHETQYTRLFRS